ncbi:trans-sulfuration enzyme family protein [Deinococcus yavapaiensis]|uniref:Cystathionine gamma-synthase n=1 Tax=Deinococcus yavapaiensis KR-236 TaxID=694435 RepID=A0A318SAF0_9DEIO|nr:aminotransferase class I/II-fold pyridoxal phosphate-dependent enzyme [Deinococcus yavapaiensis]PYE56329.1 cystathionine gamma-synthase [Deinococcus yavapaiensis KR-236]
MKELDLSTLAARAGEIAPEDGNRALIEPIHQTTVYTFDDLDHLERFQSGSERGHIYYRNGNPNRDTLERALAALEGTQDAMTAASGMAAISAVFLALVKPGERILADNRVYGVTYSLLAEELPKLGIHTDWVDANDLDAVRAAMTPDTKLVHAESLTNPLVTVADVPRLAQIAHEGGALLSIDNTFASPAVLKPASLGADVVTHSVSKYLNGHSTALGGVILGSGEIVAKCRAHLTRYGGTMSAFDAWMTLQGVKTLGLRMRAHSGNASAVADVLENHPRVKAVYYPGLTSHPQFDLAHDLMPNGFGGMMALEVEDAPAFVRALKGKIPLAPSLADVATTLSYPWGTSHRALPEQRRMELGITPGLLRLSVGIEEIGDLLDDLEGALV